MKQEISESELLTKLSAAVSYLYPHDKSCPSVLVSTLKDGKIYTSIVRYGNFESVDYSGVKGKLVLCNAKGSNLREALVNLANTFLYYLQKNQPKLNPLEELLSLFEPNTSFRESLQDKRRDFQKILNEALEASYDGR